MVLEPAHKRPERTFISSENQNSTLMQYRLPVMAKQFCDKMAEKANCPLMSGDPTVKK